jgi:hypothetical protein
MESLGKPLRTVHKKAANVHPCHASLVRESWPVKANPASNCAMPSISTNSRAQDRIERRVLS